MVTSLDQGTWPARILTSGSSVVLAGALVRGDCGTTVPGHLAASRGMPSRLRGS